MRLRCLTHVTDTFEIGGQLKRRLISAPMQSERRLLLITSTLFLFLMHLVAKLIKRSILELSLRARGATMVSFRAQSLLLICVYAFLTHSILQEAFFGSTPIIFFSLTAVDGIHRPSWTLRLLVTVTNRLHWFAEGGAC